MRRFLFLALILAMGCSDALEQTSSAGQVIAVVNTGPKTLAVVSATTHTATAIDLPASTYTGERLAARGSVILASLGTGAELAVIDLALSTDTVIRTLSLPGHAWGAAIESDSIAWVALLNAGQVARQNYRTGARTLLTVGGSPATVVIALGRVFVINSNDYPTPSGPSWITVIDPAAATILDSIPLSGERARYATVGDDGWLYVVLQAGAEGKLSIVDPPTRREVVVINGLDRWAGPVVFHPSGRLLVASSVNGILEVNTLTRSLTRGPNDGIKPGGHPVTGLAVDLRGRVYAVDPNGCTAQAGQVHVLEAPPGYRELRTVPVAGCPIEATVALKP